MYTRTRMRTRPRTVRSGRSAASNGGLPVCDGFGVDGGQAMGYTHSPMDDFLSSIPFGRAFSLARGGLEESREGSEKIILNELIVLKGRIAEIPNIPSRCLYQIQGTLTPPRCRTPP